MYGSETLIIYIFIFLLGAIIGSFLNVLALRYNTGRTIYGRSACSSCSHELSWFELFPLFSFLVLKGHCRFCKSKLSIQYFIVEVLTGIIFVSVFFKSISIYDFLFFALLASIFIVIGIYDIRHTIVPNSLSFSAALLSFSGIFFDFHSLSFVIPTFFQLFAGPIVALPLFLLWLVSKGRWMGLGDAKLTLSLGWLLGIQIGLAAILVAFWAGALYGITVLLISYIRRKFLSCQAWKSRLFLSHFHHTISSEVPFAPFLLLGFAAGFFFEGGLIQLILWNI